MATTVTSSVASMLLSCVSLVPTIVLEPCFCCVCDTENDVRNKERDTENEKTGGLLCPQEEQMGSIATFNRFAHV